MQKRLLDHPDLRTRSQSFQFRRPQVEEAVASGAPDKAYLQKLLMSGVPATRPIWPSITIRANTTSSTSRL